MAFHVEQLAYELIAAVQPLQARIKRHDRSLADQLTRAASSVVRCSDARETTVPTKSLKRMSR